MTTKVTASGYYHKREVTSINGTASPIESVSVYREGWQDSFTGVPLRAFRTRIARALQATTPASGFKRFLTYAPSSIRSEFSVNSDTSNVNNYRLRMQEGAVLRTGFQPSDVSSSEIVLADNLAREKFYEHYREAQTRFQGGVFLGELMELYRMLRRPAGNLRNRLLQYHKALKNTEGRKVLKRKTTKAKNAYLSGLWLEYVYGWAPLLSDTDGAIRAMVHHDDYPESKIYIKGTGSSSDEPTLLGTNIELIGLLKTESNVVAYVSDQVTYTGVVRSAAEKSIQRSRNWGYDITNWAPTIWELMPYSFLIDYFANVGDVIDAWGQHRVFLAWGRRTARRSSIVEIVDAHTSLVPDPPAVSLGESMSHGKWRDASTSFSRSPIDTVPIPDFRLKLNISPKHWANMSALVVQWRKFPIRF